MMKYALTAILAITPIAQRCQETAPPPIPPASTLPPCQGDIIYVTDDEPTGCDLIPPQRLDLLITTDDYQAICDHSGGRIIYIDHISAHCADIDY